nr:hybrid signal transduction histidine kinase M [Tanacetum cinerariifolium]
TGSDNNPVIPLLDKLSTVTQHHLLTRVPVKLDIENWNFASCVYVSKIFVKAKRLVVEHPQSAKEAWGSNYRNNKRSRTIALNAELRSLKPDDLSIDAYFRKIELIATILTSLGSPISSEDVVTFTLEARSMLTTEEMRLKSMSESLPIDSLSSSPMVLLADSCTNCRPSNTQVKSWRPCYNFAKGSCRFGDSCKFVHDAQVKSRNNSGVSNSQGNNTNELFVNLLGQLRNMGLTGSSPLAQTTTNRGTCIFLSAKPKFYSLSSYLSHRPGLSS